MNKSPQHQNKHRDQGGCQSFWQQVQLHFGLPLRVTVVAVIPAPAAGTVVNRYIIMCPKVFNSPDSGVALHFLCQRYISCERRFQASLLSKSTDGSRRRTIFNERAGGRDASKMKNRRRRGDLPCCYCHSHKIQLVRN